MSAVDRYAQERESEGLIGERWVRGIRFTLNRVTQVWSRLGIYPIPSEPSELTSKHLASLRDSSGWARSTVQFYFASLRGFAKWAKNDLADDRAVWRLPSGVAKRRRWLTKGSLLQLMESATERGRLLVALEGFNGLRRIEVLRLRARDVNLGERLLDVCGKGRMGGKWRQVPIHAIAKRELERATRGLGPEERVLPLSASGADLVLRDSARRAGFEERGVKVSHHDLRRTFGRLAHEAGMDLVQLKHLLGHANLEMTVHYIGLDVEKMRSGLSQFEKFLQSRS